MGRLLLPAGTQRAAAMLLGVGLGVAVGAPALSACSTGPQPAAATAAAPLLPSVPDWPPAAAPVPAPVPGGPVPVPVTPPPVPDWPADGHVVVRGDSLWRIAAAHLRDRTGREPTSCEVADAVEAWWSANADVIGPDPDLLLPGQVLRAPAPLSDPRESESQP